MRGAYIDDDGTAIGRSAFRELQRRKIRAGRIAVRLGKEHPDWTWFRVADEARRQAGLGELQP